MQQWFKQLNSIINHMLNHRYSCTVSKSCKKVKNVDCFESNSFFLNIKPIFYMGAIKSIHTNAYEYIYRERDKD